MFDIGVDLAWGMNAWTGLAALDDNGRLLDARRARTDDEILTWLRPWTAEEALVAIDAPIIVRNPSGARACERAIGRHFGRYNASCHSANTTNPAFASGTRAERLTHTLGLDIDPESSAARRAIEVYPHPALISLFDLPTVLTYKDKPGRDVAHLQSQLSRLLDLIETLADAEVPLRVSPCPVWQQIRTVVATATSKALLRSIEDSVDAIVCAYIARYSRLNPQGVRVFGAVDNGYILTPVTAEIAVAADREAAAATPLTYASAPVTPPSLSVTGWSAPRASQPTVPWPKLVVPGALLAELDVMGRPSSFGTNATAAWVAAVARAVAESGVKPLDTRFGVSIEFRTPPPNNANEAWDIDNLIKPTLDALVGLVGTRPGRFDPPQADDERVDYLAASKRTAGVGETHGATIRVYDLLGASSASRTLPR